MSTVTIPGLQPRPSYQEPVSPGMASGTYVRNLFREVAPQPLPQMSPTQRAWQAAQINPNMGEIPPELSSGSRFLDQELLRRAQRMSGLADARAAVREMTRKQWLTGERTLADEEAGAVAPDYAGDWAEEQIGPPQNGTWTAPDGTRYAMRDGVVVGRSGAPTGGTWEMSAGQVGEFTGWGKTASRQNYLRDELLGKMREVPKKKEAAAPAPTPAAPAPTPAAPAPTPAAAPPRQQPQPPPGTPVQQREGESLPQSLARTSLEMGEVGEAYKQAVSGGLVPENLQVLLQSEIKANKQESARARLQLTKEQERAEQDLAEAIEILKKEEETALGFTVGSSPISPTLGPSVSSITRKLSPERRRELADKVRALEAKLADIQVRRQKAENAAKLANEKLLREELKKILKLK